MKNLILAIILTISCSLVYSQSHEFELTDLDGNSIKLSKLLEKGPVMISFWATWCVPCKEEMKVLNDIYGKYKDSGFNYVAVNTDSPKSSSKVKPYIESKNYNFIVLMDGDKTVFEKFGGQELPYSVLLNKSGEIVKTYNGYSSGDETKLEEEIKSVIAK